MRARTAVLLISAASIAGLGPRTGSAAQAPLNLYFAGMHNHTGYSDGVPGTRPADAYRVARGNGLDIMTTTEHSEGFDAPSTFSESCLPTSGGTVAECALADGLDSFRKWDANLEQAETATDGAFLAARGFEWTSDIEDHANVYLSSQYTNAKIDGGYATMDTFWHWVLTHKDALVTFNHPGDKTNQYVEDAGLALAPGPFDDFRYVPDADRRVVGIEVFNGGKSKDYTNRGGVNWIARALDKGWHVGLVGAQDTHTNDWGDSTKYARTAFLMPSLTLGSFRNAMLARHFYATTDANLRLSFGTTGGSIMGARLRRPAGSAVTLVANASDPDGEAITGIELFSNGGTKIGEASGSSGSFHVTSTWGERWYFVRVTEADGEKAYSSPIWIGADTHPYGEWLAGDLHIHTQNGHDTCMSADPTKRFDGTDCGADEMYTWSFTPGERIDLAKQRGLDFIAITDHNNVVSQSDAAWKRELRKEPADGFTLIPAYENSLPGHAQMLGASHCFGGQHTETTAPIHITYCDNPDSSPAGVNAEMSAIRAEHGIFQINHPGDYKWFTNYHDHLLDMVPDSVEVWNIGPWEYQPPAPSANDNDFALSFWERFLDAGFHVAATGGSDSHWRSTSAVQGVGQPTTWVYSDGRSWTDVLEGIHDGRTVVSHQPPAYGSPRIFLEADADGNGTFESFQGDTVPWGTKLRYRLEGAPPGAIVRIVDGGDGSHGDVYELPQTGSASFVAPSGTRWVRVELLVPDAQDARTSACDPVLGSATTLCRNRLVVLSLSSPIYEVSG